MNNENLYRKLIQKYDLSKFKVKENELFEIVNKCEFYKSKTKIQYLKPAYLFACILAVFIAGAEAKQAIKK